LLKSPLIYRVSHLNLEGLSPPMLPRGDGTGLNLPYAVIVKIRTKATIIESIKAEQSTVNDLKRFCPGLSS